MFCAVVGDVDFEKTCDFIEKNFNKGADSVGNIPVKIRNETKTLSRKGIDQANFVLAFHVPKFSEKGKYAAELLSCLMGGGLSSRLFLEIREKRNLAYSILTDSFSRKNFGFMITYVGTTMEKLDEVKKLILEEFEKVSRELTEKELDSVKEQVIGNFEVSQDDSQEALSKLLYMEASGSAEEAIEFERKIKSVKLDEVKKLAKIKDYSFFALIPEIEKS